MSQLSLLGCGSSGGGGSALSSALGLWVASDYVASPRKVIPNRNTTVAVRNNLFNYSRGAFSAYGSARLEYGVGAFVTLTEGQTGPDGLAQATRMEVTANAGTTNGRIFETYTLAAGSFVQTIWMKSNTGSDQTIAFGDLYSGTTNYTVTSTWQCFQRAFTFASPNTCAAVVRPFPVTTHDAIDILICDAECFPAGDSSIGTYATPAGHLYLGTSQADTGISVSGGVIDLTSGSVAVALADFAPGIPTRYRTVMAIVSRTDSTSTATMQVIGNADSMPYTAGTLKSALWESDTSANAHDCLQLIHEGGDFVQPSGQDMLSLFGQGYHCIGYTTWGESSDPYMGANMFLDDVTFASRDTTIGVQNQARDFQRWQVGHAVGAGRHKIAAMAVFVGTSQMTVSQYRAAYAELVALATSVTVTPPSRVVAFEGDSISSDQGTGKGFVRLYKVNQTIPSWVITRSRSGSNITGSDTSTSLTARATELDTAFPSRSMTKILSVLVGANDLWLAADTATWLSNLQTYVANRRAAGWKVAVCTVLAKGTVQSSSYVLHNSRRATVNTALRTWVGLGYCDALVDFAADAVMGTDAAANDLGIWNADGLHPNAAGQVLLEAILRPVIDAI